MTEKRKQRLRKDEFAEATNRRNWKAGQATPNYQAQIKPQVLMNSPMATLLTTKLQRFSMSISAHRPRFIHFRT